MSIRSVLAVCLIVAIVFAAPSAFAQDKARERALTAGAKIDKEAVKAAIKKGCDYLRAKQNADGSWKTTSKDCRATYFDRGTTALILLALLKGGEDQDAECIAKGFNYIYTQNPKYRLVYEVAVLILALAARYEPEEEPEPKQLQDELKKKDLSKTTLFDPPEKKQKKNFKQAPKAVKGWFTDAVKWLLSKQNQDGGWGYGMGTESRTDASNSQYVTLALHAATRCGMKVSSNVFIGLSKYMLLQQEKDGPEIEGFPVPVADFDIKKLKEMEKEFLENMRRQVEVAREQGEEITPEKLKKMTTTVPELEDPYRKFGVEPQKMKSRGWGYVPQTIYPSMPADSVVHKAIGSMTCSGVAALCVGKANIEGTGWFNKNKKVLNRGIRDGCGWLAHNFTVSQNPGSPQEWHYYYLYGLERAGILSLVRDFGKHNWYAEGGNYLLGQQQGDGSWPGELGRQNHPMPGQQGSFIRGANLDPMINSCFAILFLKRATAPVVKIPEDPYTGTDLFGGGRPKQEEGDK
jgi:hypothetical protein